LGRIDSDAIERNPHVVSPSLRLGLGLSSVGLSSVDADMQRNIQHLKERSWFDIPAVYSDGRRAIIAIEKGIRGERAFSEAFATWGQ